MKTKIITLLTPLVLFSGVASASTVNEFSPDKGAMNTMIKYSKYNVGDFEKELVSFDVEVKTLNNTVFGGSLGVFEDNENYYDLMLGYRIHIDRDLYYQANLGYRGYDFNNYSSQSLNVPYAQLEMMFRYTNGLYINFGVERMFPSEENNPVGAEEDLDYYIGFDRYLRENIYFNASYRYAYDQFGVGIKWKF